MKSKEETEDTSGNLKKSKTEEANEEKSENTKESLVQNVPYSFFQEKSDFDPSLNASIRRTLEEMKVEDNPIPGTLPDKGSSTIRRTWAEYTKKHSFTRLILFSGHTGTHTKKFNTDQSEKNYMIDSCWQEVNPDAVLDASNPRQMRYIPDHSVNEIVVDDSRFFPDKIIPDYLRMLKKGGRLVFSPGAGMGWPQMESSIKDENFEIGESGRYAEASVQTFMKLYGLQGSKRQEFINSAMKKATIYYKNMGFEKVEFNKENYVFILTK